MENERLTAVVARLAGYARSPSLKHIRDPHNLYELGKEILLAVHRAGSIWTKWDGRREDVVKAASCCWIPVQDLAAFLNSLPGPPLTLTDVKQRLRALTEVAYAEYPDEVLQPGCLTIYEAERATGTEMTAIIGTLQEFVEHEGNRLRREREERYRRSQEDERRRLEQRFLSGADCGWTHVGGSKALYCRRNGRSFRTEQDKDKRWRLYRIKDADDTGALIGTYLGRRDANKILEKIAFEPGLRF